MTVVDRYRKHRPETQTYRHHDHSSAMTVPPYGYARANQLIHNNLALGIRSYYAAVTKMRGTAVRAMTVVSVFGNGPNATV